jgi:hypothetical protein
LSIEDRSRHDVGDIYLWLALDQQTKLIPSFVIEKRAADMARRLTMDSASRLALPKLHESDDRDLESREHQPIVQISTDGFAAYPEAVNLAFGPYARFGALVKDYRNADQRAGTRRVK